MDYVSSAFKQLKKDHRSKRSFPTKAISCKRFYVLLDTGSESGKTEIHLLDAGFPVELMAGFTLTIGLLKHLIIL